MSKHKAVEFTPYGLTTDYYDNETVFDTTTVDSDGNRKDVPMRTNEFNHHHATKENNVQKDEDLDTRPRDV